MEGYKYINVFYKDLLVGVLAKKSDGLITFEYDNWWLDNGFSISPYNLPLVKKLFAELPAYMFKDKLSVFNDSLAGGLLNMHINRLLNINKIDPTSIDRFNRLIIVGKSGIGALSYVSEGGRSKNFPNCVELADSLSNILKQQYSEDLDKSFEVKDNNGAIGQIWAHFDNKDWLIKNVHPVSPKNYGELEYKYSQCVKQCGINMLETRLLKSKKHNGYFATERFDCKNGQKFHVHKVNSLLDLNKHVQNFDYNDLIKITSELTKSYQDIEQIYRIMCFNVFAHNRDDRSDNFAFIYDDKKRCWHLSPAFDIVYNAPFNDTHATAVNGEKIKPGIDNLLAVANNIGMDVQKAKAIAKEIQDKVMTILLSDI